MPDLATSFTYVLVAGVKTTLPGGRYFRLITADSAVDVEFFTEGGESMGTAVGMLGGFAFGIEPSDIGIRSRLVGFSKVTLLSSVGQTVLAVVSRQPIVYDRLTGSITTTSSPGTVLNSVADVALAAAATTIILAANANRKEAIISNLLANASTMRIGDVGAAAANGVPLAPGETVILETSDAVYGFNPGAIQSVAASEIAA